ncbi:MAG: alanine racemase [Firmicutes bacterium]|nr:alanine racemase [Bacillota bacterium]
MQVVDCEALKHNAEYFRTVIGDARLCAVVKNNAYGHGLERVAETLNGIADCFAVGEVSEAEKIASNGKDVLLLLPQNGADTEKALTSGYIVTIDSFETLSRVKSLAEKTGRKARAHLKINSGMSRLGFDSEQLGKLIAGLQNAPQIEIEGVYSHFWGKCADSCDRQLSLFKQCAEFLENRLNATLIKHVASTSATLLNCKYHLDMVRVGLGLYGYGNDRLAVVKTVFANVIAVRTVEKGEKVGYDGKYSVNASTRIAVLNTGYASGFARRLVGGKISINGKFYPVAAVCMAMVMADVGSDDVSVGDVAVLLGNGVNIANDDVTVYELLCNLR